MHPLALQNDSRGLSHEWGWIFIREVENRFSTTLHPYAAILCFATSLYLSQHSVLSPLENSISSRLRAQGAQESAQIYGRKCRQIKQKGREDNIYSKTSSSQEAFKLAFCHDFNMTGLYHEILFGLNIDRTQKRQIQKNVSRKKIRFGEDQQSILFFLIDPMIFLEKCLQMSG